MIYLYSARDIMFTFYIVVLRTFDNLSISFIQNFRINRNIARNNDKVISSNPIYKYNKNRRCIVLSAVMNYCIHSLAVKSRDWSTRGALMLAVQ